MRWQGSCSRRACLWNLISNCPDWAGRKAPGPSGWPKPIKNELTLLLLQKVADPRLSGALISRVVVTPDLKQAKIYFTVPAGKDSGPALKGMNRARGFFRSHLAKVLNLRYTPELLFYFDNLNEEVERIDDLVSADREGAER